jgi:hypothetical protein
MNIFFKKKRKITVLYVLEVFSIVAGLVLMWRGLWYIFDELDVLLFGGHDVWTALLSVLLGLVLFYIPDKDLKELESH